MGILAFQWGEHELTLLQNREKFDAWAIKPAAWDKNNNNILRGVPEDNMIIKDLLKESFGTWFGISKKGRVVFLVDVIIKIGPFLWCPDDFLQGEMSPEDYAKQLSEFDPDCAGLIYEIIVADINTKSMYYISKEKAEEPHVHYEKVGFGVHTLSSIGRFDGHSTKEKRMKDLFNEMIGDFKKEKVTLNQMAKRFIYEPVESDGTDLKKEKELYATVSTTALAVKTTKEVMFHERYLANGEWKDCDFSFKME